MLEDCVVILALVLVLQPGSRMKEVHTFVTIFTVLGLMFAVTSFVQYTEVICCGEVPLWSTWISCFCPCFYAKVMAMYALSRQASPQRKSGRSAHSSTTSVSINAANVNVTHHVVSSSGRLLSVNDYEDENSAVHQVCHL